MEECYFKQNYRLQLATLLKEHSSMCIFQVFKIVWMVPNRAKHHIQKPLIRLKVQIDWLVST